MKRNQVLVFSGLFTVVTAAMLLAYVFLFRTEFVILFDNIREQDSAAIIAELESENIEFQLAGNGTQVLVPEGDADRARVLVAGAGIPMGGVVGFELFNESDMGLTDFAQKINYQRALQGELARTIMMMEGIAFARVHLSLPERTLFKTETLGPKAAVTVQARPGSSINDKRVIGIQHLVSSAVTGLTANDVAVLDQNGQLVSSQTSTSVAKDDPIDERSALEAYYHARATTAAEQLLPGLDFQMQVTAIDLPESPFAGNEQKQSTERNFSLRIILRTEMEIAAADQADVRQAVANAVDLKPDNGDFLRFEVATLDYDGPKAPVVTSETPPREAVLPPALSDTYADNWGVLSVVRSIWFWLALIAMAAIALPLIRRRSRLTSAEQQSFAELLTEQLSTTRQESEVGR